MLEFARRIRARTAEDRGSVLVLVAASVPVLALALALVLDVGLAFAKKRELQGAADAAALAAASLLPCTAANVAAVEATAAEYVAYNVDDASSLEGLDVTCPYGGTAGKVEVKVDDHDFGTSFARIAGIFSVHVGARAVAGVQSTIVPGEGTYECVDGEPPAGYVVPPGAPADQCGSTADGTYECLPGPAPLDNDPGPDPRDPEDCKVLTPGTPGVMKATAFARSTACGINTAAIQWAGGVTELGALAANGGFWATGTAGKKAKYLGLGRKDELICQLGLGNVAEIGMRDADGACGFGTGFGGASCFELFRGRIATDGLCRVDGTGPVCTPMEYPITPPTRPPDCRPTGTPTIDSANWFAPAGQPARGPGSYCSNVPLTISLNGATFNGYTFFAPKITAASNNMTFVGGVVNGRATVFVAEATDPAPLTCNLLGTTASCALILQGQNLMINGDIFAPNGTIWISGGSVVTGGGEGFMESEKLLISGNLASFRGGGPPLGGTQAVEEPGHWKYTPGESQPGHWIYTEGPDEVVYECCSLDE